VKTKSNYLCYFKEELDEIGPPEKWKEKDFELISAYSYDDAAAQFVNGLEKWTEPLEDGESTEIIIIKKITDKPRCFRVESSVSIEYDFEEIKND